MEAHFLSLEYWRVGQNGLQIRTKGIFIAYHLLKSSTFPPLSPTGELFPGVQSGGAKQFGSGYYIRLLEDGYISPTEHRFDRVSPLDKCEIYDEADYDWTGPYRYYLPVGQAITNVPSGSDAGVIYGAADELGLGSNVGIPAVGGGWFRTLIGTDSTSPCGVSASFTSDHVSALHAGMWGKFVQTWDTGSGIHIVTKYFTVVHSPIYDGEDSVTSFMWAYNWGTSGMTPDPAPADSLPWTLQMFLSTSDGVTADGLPAVKTGFYPSCVIRVGNETSGDNRYYPVHLIGSPANPIDITSTTVNYDADGAIDTTTTATQRVNGNVIVGETYPTKDSKTFRMGKWEIEELQGSILNLKDQTNYYPSEPGTAGPAPDNPNTINQWCRFDGGMLTPPGSTDNAEIPLMLGNGPKAYWTLTGRAFSHFGDTPEGDTQDITPVTATAIEIHQERTFIGGFNADTPPLRGLPEAQDLGLTIISSRSNQLTDFTSGPLDADSLQFIISSKAGGKISWLKSQFNQLFVGTTQEEYVVTDTPITGTNLNIQLQSSYGSEYLKEAVIFGSDIVFIPTGKMTIRSMSFEERRQRYETDDLFQFARHLIKGDTIERIEVVSTETQRLFVRTGLGKVYCFTSMPGNQVYGWTEWGMSSDHTLLDIVGTVDDSGNASLWGRTSATFASDAPLGLYFTPDSTRLDYRVDAGVDATSLTTETVVIPAALVGETLSVIATFNNGSEVVTVYLGDVTPSTTTMTIPTLPNAPTQVVVGLPYDFELAPNIPELFLPGKGSTGATLGRNKNITRIRILLNQARGAVVEGYSILPAPATAGATNVVSESAGFYSIPVIGEYGPQPTILIKQSVPYGFEVSGYNAEYDFGD